jgi:hypothetical protein
MFQLLRCNVNTASQYDGWIVFKGVEVNCLTAPRGVVPEILTEDDLSWFELPAMVITQDHFKSIFEKQQLGFTNCRPSVVNQKPTLQMVN